MQDASHSPVVEPEDREGAGGDLARQDLCNQKAAEDEEYVDAGKSTGKRRVIVKGKNGKHLDRVQPVNFGTVGACLFRGKNQAAASDNRRASPNVRLGVAESL